MYGRITAKYISDIPSIEFKKGVTYDGFVWANGEYKYRLLCYLDNEGEEYGVDAQRFDIIEDNSIEDTIEEWIPPIKIKAVYIPET